MRSSREGGSIITSCAPPRIGAQACATCAILVDHWWTDPWTAGGPGGPIYANTERKNAPPVYCFVSQQSREATSKMLHIAAASLALLGPPLVARVTRVEARTPLAPLALTDTLGRRALFSAAITVAILPAAPALAESTLVTRQQAYTRYVPRIERGRDFWAGGLRKYIANSDWAAITKEFEPVTKSKGGAIAKFFGPMRLWASSFSGKTVSDKTVAMNEAMYAHHRLDCAPRLQWALVLTCIPAPAPLPSMALAD